MSNGVIQPSYSLDLNSMNNSCRFCTTFGPPIGLTVGFSLDSHNMSYWLQGFNALNALLLDNDAEILKAALSRQI